MKDFVPHQESLELKELGFDEPCFGYYHEDKSLSYTNMVSQNTNSFWKINNKVITAPTFSQAFRFFRETYKIRFFIQSGMSDLGEFFKVIFPDGEQRNMSYTTYEEAELVCIIKLIEIVKTK